MIDTLVTRYLKNKQKSSEKRKKITYLAKKKKTPKINIQGLCERYNFPPKTSEM